MPRDRRNVAALRLRKMRGDNSPRPVTRGGFEACQALTSRVMLAERCAGHFPEFTVLAVVALLVALAIAFAAGYFTRDLVSRKRRAEARRWREYHEPDWLRAAAPANTNEATKSNAVAKVATGELGQMLDRWESRARARRAG
jgi:hypothetical protein